jgi:type IV pilus assembly protein PilB
MRLMDMGIDAVYVGSAVLCVASQRLLRKICDSCKEEITHSEEELKRVGLTPQDIAGSKFYKGKGCAECHNTGYRGRLAVYEVMPVNNVIREIIFKKGTLGELKAAAKTSGLKNLRDAATIKWRKGFTTLEEVLGETFE